jgi:hypothetical protein
MGNLIKNMMYSIALFSSFGLWLITLDVWSDGLLVLSEPNQAIAHSEMFLFTLLLGFSLLVWLNQVFIGGRYGGHDK